MSNENNLFDKIKALSDIEDKKQLNIANVYMINDGHLRPSLYGITLNFDLTNGTMISWILSGMFLGVSLILFSLWGQIPLLVFMTLVQFMFIYLGHETIKEYKRFSLSTINIQKAIDDDRIDYDIETIDGTPITFMRSKDEKIGESLGIVARYIALYNTRSVLGGVLLKHKNHTPMMCLMLIACIIMIMISNNVIVALVSLTMLLSMTTYFHTGGMLFKRVSRYLGSIKSSLTAEMEVKLKQLSEREKDDS